jgi:hypothetical protein
VGQTILLSGAMGSGKSTLMGLGYRALASHWGPTATIDQDDVLRMVDPRWELDGDDQARHFEIAGWHEWLLARSFLTQFGFECVVIGGNGLHTPAEGLNDLITFLLGVGDVFHVTLDPSLDEIRRRVAQRGGDASAASLAEHVAWMRARYRDWTCRVDNTSLRPEEALAEIARRVGAGEGRVTGPLPAD